MNDNNVVASVELIEMDGKFYNPDQLTPTVYFDYVKNMKKDIEDENLQVVADNCLALLKKTKVTGQTSAAKKIVEQYELIMRELKAASFGFKTICYRSDIEKFITTVENKSVKIIELSKYPREVDDSVIDKLIIARENELFDEYYVLFTDYTMKETKKIAKHRRDKDPILFGAFTFEPSNSTNRIPYERMFYIGDWVDEYCDLTLEEMLKQYEKSENAAAKYTIDIPKDVDSLKEYMGLIEKKDPEKAESVLDKIKAKINNPRRGRGRRKKE